MVPFLVYMTILGGHKIVTSEPDIVDKTKSVLDIKVRIVDMHNTTVSKPNFWGTPSFVRFTIGSGQIT